MTIESIPTHFIYCWDCHKYNTPKPLKITYEAFRRKLVYRWLSLENKIKVCKGTYKHLDEKYKEFDSYNHKPEEFFDHLGLYCLSCNSQNIELKYLYTLPMAGEKK